jgi:hypothetical protein
VERVAYSVERGAGRMIKRVLILTVVFSVLYVIIGLLLEPESLSHYRRWLFGRVEEEASVRQTVLLYNKILTDLYASDGQTLRLNDFPASVILKHELYRDLDFLRSRGLLIIYDMADLTFMKLKMRSPFLADVEVYEEWNYIYQKNPSRKIASSIKGFGQGFRYILKRQKTGWLVIEVIPVDIEEPEKRDEFYY